MIALTVMNLFTAFDADEIAAVVSDDGGESFGPGSALARVSGVEFNGVRTPLLVTADGDAAGTVYVAWADCRFRPDCVGTDIVLSRSADGIAWEAPRRIPVGPLELDEEHFVPGLAVQPGTSGASARVAVVYHSWPRQAGCIVEECPGIEAWTIVSRDGGRTWHARQRLTAEAMPLGWIANTGQGRILGDYMVSWVGGRPVPVFSVASRPPEASSGRRSPRRRGCRPRCAERAASPQQGGPSAEIGLGEVADRSERSPLRVRRRRPRPDEPDRGQPSAGPRSVGVEADSQHSALAERAVEREVPVGGEVAEAVRDQAAAVRLGRPEEMRAVADHEVGSRVHHGVRERDWVTAALAEVGLAAACEVAIGGSLCTRVHLDDDDVGSSGRGADELLCAGHVERGCPWIGGEADNGDPHPARADDGDLPGRAGVRQAGGVERSGRVGQTHVAGIASVVVREVRSVKPLERRARANAGGARNA